MSEMAERVGDAIVALIRETQERNGATYLEGMKGALGRAALGAMREPTDDMREAVRRHYAPHFTRDFQFIESWVEAAVENQQRMIDEALK